MKNSKTGRSLLTPKETQIINALAKGLLYKEIAAKESVTIDTVKKHVKNIYKKLGVRNRTEAVNIYSGINFKRA